MDAIKQCRQLKDELEQARKTAIELRDALQNPEHLDLMYIDLALETVSLRLGYLEKQAEAAKAAKPEKPSKKEKDTE